MKYKIKLRSFKSSEHINGKGDVPIDSFNVIYFVKIARNLYWYRSALVRILELKYTEGFADRFNVCTYT